MAQPWLQVIGMIVEFIGVLLISWEWFAAKRQEAAERALEKTQSRSEESMAMMQRAQPANPSMQRHLEMTRDMQRRMTETRVEATRASFGGMRARAVAFALCFIVAGFALQLLGAWPGCCRAIGIVPAG